MNVLKDEQQSNLGVSIIICCYNSEKRLPNTLGHLALQKVPSSIAWEVIVVDNNSSDRTSIVAKELWDNNGSLTSLNIYHQSLSGLYHARDLGIKKAKFKYLIFCDDDNWLYSDYVRRVYDIFSSNPSIGIVGGQTFGVYESPAPEWFIRFSNFFAIGEKKYETGYIKASDWGVWGAASAYNKAIYDCLDKEGFKPILLGRIGNKMTSGEDREMCLIVRKLGYKIYYDSSLISGHYMPISRYDGAKFLEMCLWNGHNLPLFTYLDAPDSFSVRAILYSISKGAWFLLRNRHLVDKKEINDLIKTYFEVKGTLKGNISLLLNFKKNKSLFGIYNSKLLYIKAKYNES